MKKLIFGFLAIIIGLPGFSLSFSNFIGVVTGALPLILILGGGLAFYLGFEEIRAEKNEKYPPLADDGIEENQASQTCNQTAPLEQSLESAVLAPKDLKTPNSNPDPVDESKEDKKQATKVLNEQPAPKEDGPSFRGNTNTLVFHSLECNFSKGKKCTASFATREDALAQGYKPCKVCNP